MKLHRARGTAELREVASGSTTHGLWLRNRKVRSQISGIDRSQFRLGSPPVPSLKESQRYSEEEGVQI